LNIARCNRARHARRVADLRLQGFRGGLLAAMIETKRSIARSTSYNASRNKILRL